MPYLVTLLLFKITYPESSPTNHSALEINGSERLAGLIQRAARIA